MTSSPSPSEPKQKALSKLSKVAIVTGASSGIGSEAVRRLIASKYRVVANSRKITSANALDCSNDLSPLKRLAEVGEVVKLLLYMESAPFLNGEVVHLDGGAHAGKW